MKFLHLRFFVHITQKWRIVFGGYPRIREKRLTMPLKVYTIKPLASVDKDKLCLSLPVEAALVGQGH